MVEGPSVSRARTLFRKSDDDSEYTPLYPGVENGETVLNRPYYVVDHDEDEMSDYYSEGSEGGQDDRPSTGQPFSWIEYFIFMLLGIAMLWAWNMFLAAAPYFQTRFADNPAILAAFAPGITSVSCVTNLGSMIILSYNQKKANYPQRILTALFINIVVFTLLAISTTHFRSVSSPGYLVFTLFMVFFAALATAFCQNGVFAFAAGFGHIEYINAVLTGNAVAGVLPAIAQIASVLAVPTRPASATITELAALDKKENTSSAFAYFLLATVVSGVTIFAFIPLVRKHNRMIEAQMTTSITSVEVAEQAARKNVTMWTLWKKTHWHASALYLCFTVTMFFPVLTQKVLSLIPKDDAPRLFQPSAFIPLGFLVWNVGDLSGRVITLIPFKQKQHPLALFVFSILRIAFIPMYFLCNIGGHGAIIKNDAFYLFVVQYLFGLSNGWLGSTCMMQANDYVEDGEKEAAGGFLVLMLVAGLTTGSLLSFSVAGVK